MLLVHLFKDALGMVLLIDLEMGLGQTENLVQTPEQEWRILVRGAATAIFALLFVAKVNQVKLGENLDEEERLVLEQRENGVALEEAREQLQVDLFELEVVLETVLDALHLLEIHLAESAVRAKAAMRLHAMLLLASLNLTENERAFRLIS